MVNSYMYMYLMLSSLVSSHNVATTSAVWSVYVTRKGKWRERSMNLAPSSLNLKVYPCSCACARHLKSAWSMQCHGICICLGSSRCTMYLMMCVGKFGVFNSSADVYRTSPSTFFVHKTHELNTPLPQTLESVQAQSWEWLQNRSLSLACMRVWEATPSSSPLSSSYFTRNACRLVVIHMYVGVCGIACELLLLREHTVLQPTGWGSRDGNEFWLCLFCRACIGGK